MTNSACPRAPELTAPCHALPPLRVPVDLRLIPEQFTQLWAENREAVLELATEGSLIVMT